MVLRARTLANHAGFMKDLTIIFHTCARLELDTHIVLGDQGGTEDISTKLEKNAAEQSVMQSVQAVGSSLFLMSSTFFLFFIH